jgi:hypothetical protein
VPVEAGSYYLFATIAKSDTGERHNGAEKAETLLRQAVYDVMKR